MSRMICRPPWQKKKNQLEEDGFSPSSPKWNLNIAMDELYDSDEDNMRTSEGYFEDTSDDNYGYYYVHASTDPNHPYEDKNVESVWESTRNRILPFHFVIFVPGLPLVPGSSDLRNVQEIIFKNIKRMNGFMLDITLSSIRRGTKMVTPQVLDTGQNRIRIVARCTF